MARAAKALCFWCDKKMAAGVPFCPSCDRPTEWATLRERTDWEVSQWRRDPRTPVPWVAATVTARGRSHASEVVDHRIITLPDPARTVGREPARAPAARTAEPPRMHAPTPRETAPIRPAVPMRPTAPSHPGEPVVRAGSARVVRMIAAAFSEKRRDDPRNVAAAGSGPADARPAGPRKPSPRAPLVEVERRAPAKAPAKRAPAKRAPAKPPAPAKPRASTAPARTPPAPKPVGPDGTKPPPNDARPKPRTTQTLLEEAVTMLADLSERMGALEEKVASLGRNGQPRRRLRILGR